MTLFLLCLMFEARCFGQRHRAAPDAGEKTSVYGLKTRLGFHVCMYRLECEHPYACMLVYVLTFK